MKSSSESLFRPGGADATAIRSSVSASRLLELCSLALPSFRASYYEISVDDGPWEKQKSSGLSICTGTGSKAW